MKNSQPPKKYTFQERLHDLKVAQGAGSSKNVAHAMSRICIMPRGEITRKTFDIWATQLPKLKPDLAISCEFVRGCDCIVVSDKCPVSKIYEWSKLNSDELKQYHVVKSAWIVESLKAKEILVASPYMLNFGLVSSEPDSPPPVADHHASPCDSIASEEELHKKTKKAKLDSSKFACVQSGTITNHNKHITDLLDELIEIYEMEGDEWRKLSYKKASNALKKMDAINDVSQLDGVRGFGSSIRDKIHEILTTGSLKKLENFKSNPSVGVRIEFCKIWGVGPKKAHDLAMGGYKSIEDLRARGTHLLTKQQSIGLMRFEDLQERIPRHEMDEIKSFVSARAEAILPGAPLVDNHSLNLNTGVECCVCGSYSNNRRGKSSSGDIDILFGPPPGEEEIHFLPELIAELSDIGFLTDHLTLPDEHREPGMSLSYMGICRLPGESRKYRRIDLKSYPRSQFAFALLYFTGSDHFNRSMRFYCNKIGYTLNDKGLSKCGRDNSRKKVWSGASIVCHTEKEIFDFLEMEYKEPCDRNVYEERRSTEMNEVHDS